jgi:hypothetical protein
MILRDSIDVCATPSEFFAFFDEMDNDRYCQWHPDHELFRCTRGQGARVGHERTILPRTDFDFAV